MLDETGSSHQEEVDERPEAATLEAPDSLDSELLAFGDLAPPRAAGEDAPAAAGAGQLDP